MIIIKQSVSATVPVKLIDHNNQPYGTSGVLPAQLTCYVSKEDAKSYHKGISSTNWKEVNAAYQKGEYRLFFEGGELNQLGFLTFTISGTDIVDCAEWVYISNIRPTEIYDVIGSPNNSTVSQDISDIRTTIGSGVTLIRADVSTVKQGVMGKQKLDLSASPPRHYIYETDGSTLQVAQVDSTPTERTYDPV